MKPEPKNVIQLQGKVTLGWIEKNTKYYLIDLKNNKTIAIIWYCNHLHWNSGFCIDQKHDKLRIEYTKIDVAYALSKKKYDLTKNYYVAIKHCLGMNFIQVGTKNYCPHPLHNRQKANVCGNCGMKLPLI